MMVPVVHLNGTPADRLIEDLCNAHYAIRQAYDELKKCAPNGRDYYVHAEQDALKIATNEHLDRLRRLDSVMQEVSTLAEAISAQKK